MKTSQKQCFSQTWTRLPIFPSRLLVDCWSRRFSASLVQLLPWQHRGEKEKLEEEEEDARKPRGGLLFSSYSVGGRLVHWKLALAVVLRYRGERGEGGEEGRRGQISLGKGGGGGRGGGRFLLHRSLAAAKRPHPFPSFFLLRRREKKAGIVHKVRKKKRGTFRVPRRLGKRRRKKLVDPQVLLFHHSDCDARRSFFPVCCCVWEYKTSATDAFRDIRGINRTLRKGIRPEVTSSPQ